MKPTKKKVRRKPSASTELASLRRNYVRLGKDFEVISSANEKFIQANKGLALANDKIYETLKMATHLYEELSDKHGKLLDENQKLNEDLLRVTEGKLWDLAAVALERARVMPGHKPS